MTKTFKVGLYASAYFDVLNQKEAINKLNYLPKTEEEKKEYIQHLNETVGVIDLFRTSFYHIIQGIKKGKESRQKEGFDQLDEKQKEIIKIFLNSNIKIHSFSDTLILFTPLSIDSNTTPISEIYNLLSISSIVFLINIANGIFFRGGIEASYGTDYFKKEIYGPALYHSYQLENEIAQYPRIVVGGFLSELVKSEFRNNGNSTETRLKHDLAEKCMNFIKVSLR